MEYTNCFGKFEVTKDQIVLAEDFLKLSNTDPVPVMSPNLPFSLLTEMRKPVYHDGLVQKNILLTKIAIAAAVNDDTMIIQAISSIEDLDRVCNGLTKRVREWYSYHFPELSKSVDDNELFITRVIHKTRNEYMIEMGLDISMGAELESMHYDSIIALARNVNNLYLERTRLMEYLDKVMERHCRNVYALVGGLIGAKLLEKAGSLRGLAMMPSSTIQILGAERALFRHLRNRKARPPKHGYILSHPLVLNSRRDEKGRLARLLAAKICIAAKVDYFKGEFIADKLLEDLDSKK